MELSTVLKMKSSFYINDQRLHQLCQKYGLCTNMTDKEYDVFLSKVIDDSGKGVLLTDELRDSLARVIYNYSDLDKFLHEKDKTPGEFLQYIIYAIITASILVIDLEEDYENQED